MDLLQLLILLIIVGICGAIAELIVGYTPGGPFMSIIIGVIGAFIGSWLPTPSPIGLLTIQAVPSNITFNLLWTIVGSVVLLIFIRILQGERPRLFRWRL